MIQPRTLKGFRDLLPESMIPREHLIDQARRVYRSYGFVPIETPALEYAEVLCGKGSEETDRQMFRFEDHGGRDVGMRFDLTVPLARFVAQHANDLGFPFKRYHIGPVWRGEKPQVGRFREFVQCDFDTIGTTSIASDVETALVINDLMQALGFERFAIRINNRKILNGLLQKFGLRQFGPAVLRGIDKLPKIGRDSVRQEILDSTSLAPDLVDRILALAEVRGSNQQMLGGLSTFCGGDDLATTGLNELHQIVSSCKAVGLVEPRLRIDPSIARGLDYYTGTIYETFLDDLPEIGSVCSGGRYDNLAELFTKQQLPGIGASLGLDRLLAAMETLSLLPQQRATAEVMVVQFSAGLLDRYLQIASNLRRRRVAVEVYPEAKKLNTQFKYADRRGFAAVIIAGEEEFLSAHVQVKWMADGSQSKIPLDANCDHLAKWLTDRLSNNQ